jgi:hypothetical protein
MAAAPALPAHWNDYDMPAFGSSNWRARANPNWLTEKLATEDQLRRADKLKKRRVPESYIAPFTLANGDPNPELGIMKTLADWDVKRNPRMTSVTGLEKWKRAHPGRLYKWEDINNDGFPDALAGWDANRSHTLENNEISHVNGYYLKRSDWPYRMRYQADKDLTPQFFVNGNMNMPRYIRQMHRATIDPNTGVISYNANDADLQHWNATVAHGHYKVKKPGKQISKMNLWKMWIFRPVYDCFIHLAGDPTQGVIDVQLEDGTFVAMNAHPDFKVMLVGQQAYKFLFTDFVIKRYIQRYGEITPHQEAVIKQQKEFKERIKNLLETRLHPDNRHQAWQDVHDFLVLAAGQILRANGGAFNLAAITARYNQLLENFTNKEAIHNELAYANPANVDYSFEHMIPGGSAEAYWENHPRPHPDWRDADKMEHIFTGTHAGFHPNRDADLAARGAALERQRAYMEAQARAAAAARERAAARLEAARGPGVAPLIPA